MGIKTVKCGYRAGVVAGKTAKKEHLALVVFWFVCGKNMILRKYFLLIMLVFINKCRFVVYVSFK